MVLSPFGLARAMAAIISTQFDRKNVTDAPSDLRVSGFEVPFRVASARIDDGSHIYLGLSERDELRVLKNLRFRFILLWLLIILFGSAIVFYTTCRMLTHVRRITDAASRIGESDLSSQSARDEAQ